VQKKSRAGTKRGFPIKKVSRSLKKEKEGAFQGKLAPEEGGGRLKLFRRWGGEKDFFPLQGGGGEKKIQPKKEGGKILPWKGFFQFVEEREGGKKKKRTPSSPVEVGETGWGKGGVLLRDGGRSLMELPGAAWGSRRWS